MKAFLVSFVALVVITVAANQILMRMGPSSAEATVSEYGAISRARARAAANPLVPRDTVSSATASSFFIDMGIPFLCIVLDMPYSSRG